MNVAAASLQTQSVSFSSLSTANYLGHLYKTFHALPQNGKVIEVIKRIILVVCFPILFPLLALLDATQTQTHHTPISIPKISPVKIPPKPVQIAHYDHISFDGYDTEELKAKQAEIDQKSIPLHVCPKRAENACPVNFEKVDAYIASLPASHKDAFIKIWKNNFLHISMDDFDRRLKECVERFNALIKGQNYVVGFASAKSSQWVASLALKDLTNLPASWMTLGRQNTNVLTYRICTPEENLTIPDDESIPLVIFDDCAYSGTQLKETICKIAQETKVKRTVYVIVPYVSERAHKQITTDYNKNSLMKEDQGKLNVVLISSEKRIPWAGDNLSFEEMDLIHDLIPTISFKGPMSSFLCVTDWRIPDNMPTGFGRWVMKHAVEGHINTQDECSGCKLCQIKAQEYFIAPTNEVPRPYALVKQ